MPIHVQIICACHKLVDIVDRKIVVHDVEGTRCPASGMHYRPQTLRSPAPGEGGPRIDVIGHGPVETPEGPGYGAFIRISRPRSKPPTIH